MSHPGPPKPNMLLETLPTFFFPLGHTRSLLASLGFSLVAASGSYSLVVRGLLISMASLVAKHTLLGTRASVVAPHGA